MTRIHFGKAVGRFVSYLRIPVVWPRLGLMAASGFRLYFQQVFPFQAWADPEDPCGRRRSATPPSK